MKTKIFVYRNENDPRIYVYAYENKPFLGAILNFGHRKSLWIMAGFLLSLILPLCGVLFYCPQKVFLAPLWGVLWAGMVLSVCLTGAGKDLKRHPGKRSFRE